jgi:hypothetical protein
MTNRNKIKVVETAKVFLNFSLPLKNSTIGLAIIEKMIEIITYTITVCIKYIKYRPKPIKVRIPIALIIPPESILAFTIN